ncbi:hypothetical protein CBS101457_003534 [Exobasidium rhododendri]|nr:hypothetical protein CBS101457_003534 [Exobasidium rhododendri]
MLDRDNLDNSTAIDRSCDTTVSSDDEALDAKVDDLPQVVTSARNNSLFLGEKEEGDRDDDDDDEEEEEEDLLHRKQNPTSSTKESDAEYLRKFRLTRMTRIASAIENANQTTTLPSSELSDPPTLSNSSLAKNTIRKLVQSSGSSESEDVLGRAKVSTLMLSPSMHQSDQETTSEPASPSPRKKRVVVLPDLLKDSSQSVTSSPYVIEAHRQEEERMRKQSREARVKELAKRKQKSNNRQSIEGGEDVGGAVSSASDIQEEEEVDDVDITSALQKAKDASFRRRQAEDRPKAEKPFRGKPAMTASGKGGVLQMIEDDDSDVEMQATTSRKVMQAKALSKKDTEEMHKTQARIERELKAGQANPLRVRGERATYRMDDFLSSIVEQESSAQQYNMTKTVKEDAAGGSSSDPIESASEEEETSSRSKKALVSFMPTKSPSYRFTPTLKDMSPILTDDVEDLPDVSGLRKSIIEERSKKDRLEALRRRKAQYVAMKTTNQAAEVESDNDEEQGEEEVVLVEDSSNPKLRRARDGRQRVTNRFGSPGEASDTKYDDKDDTITDSQIQRAGKIFRTRILQPDATVNNAAPVPRKGRVVKSKEQEIKKEELNDAILKRARLQNIEMRRKREAAFGRKKEVQEKGRDSASVEETVEEMLRKLREDRAGGRAEDIDHQDGTSDEEGSEYNPDEARLGEVAVDLGSGEESGEEGGEDSEDSEKENSAPVSQESVLARVPRRSRMTVDDGEEESEYEEETTTALPLLQRRSPLQPICLVDDHEEVAEENILADPASCVLPSSSVGAGFSQFFQETQVPAYHRKQSSRGSTSSSSPPRPLRNVSSTLGQFFEETQSDQPLRGESFSILDQGVVDSTSSGFSQLFGGESQVPTLHGGLMLPPSTSAKGLSLLDGTDQDNFAALRRLQESEGRLVEFESDQLPSLEDVGGRLDEEDVAALELEAFQAEMEERQKREHRKREEANITYINRDGFFTQTKPDYERFSFSQSQSQSQSQSEMQRQSEGKVLRSSMSSSTHVEDDRSAAPKKKRRFRRAISSDEEEEEGEGEGEEERGRVQARSSPVYQRLTNITAEEEEEDGVEERMGAPQNAFDVLKHAMTADQVSSRAAPSVKRGVNRFVQGEAEESDDEEEGNDGKKSKSGRGGLHGIFSDDEEGEDSGEEEDEEDDGKDLEELVDESKDDAEAEKDLLARERYFKDIEDDDQAALALHEKAIRGGLRSKRRALNMDGTLEGFLDDDYEDDYLEKKAKNPYGTIAKKRRLKGKDGLDLLEANEESQAFVRRYKEGLEMDVDLDKYSFLLPAQMEEDEALEAGRRSGSEDSEEDGGTEPTTILSHQQLKRELEERRRRRKRQAVELSDEEEGEEEAKRAEAEREERRENELMKQLKKQIYNNSSDEDDEMEEKAARHLFRDRLQESRKKARAYSVRLDPAGDDNDDAEEGEEEEEDEDEAGGEEQSFFSVQLHRAANLRKLNEQEQQRLARLQSEYVNEPEWGTHDTLRTVSAKRNASSTGGSVTSFGKNLAKGSGTKTATIGTTRTSSDSLRKRAPPSRISSKLSDVMSRHSQFSESFDD